MISVDHIVIIVLSSIVIFEGLIIYYSLKRLNIYESLLSELMDIIDYIKAQMDVLDSQGTYRSDDEVGFFWEAIKNMSDILSGLFDQQEEQDGSEKTT